MIPPLDPSTYYSSQVVEFQQQVTVNPLPIIQLVSFLFKCLCSYGCDMNSISRSPFLNDPFFKLRIQKCISLFAQSIKVFQKSNDFHDTTPFRGSRPKWITFYVMFPPILNFTMAFWTRLRSHHQDLLYHYRMRKSAAPSSNFLVSIGSGARFSPSLKIYFLQRLY